jgi:N-acetylmuramate 1-kinase
LSLNFTCENPLTSNCPPTPSPATDARLALATQWLGASANTLLASGWQLAPESLRPASSDASFRRYFRCDGLHHGKAGSLILMDAPPDREPLAPFIHAAHIFHAAGLQVPEILAMDLAQGFLLLSDLGSTTYLQALTADHDPQPLYQAAWQALIRLQAHGHQIDLPHYSPAKLIAEMQLFEEWFIGRHLNVTLNATEKDTLQNMIQQIATACAAQPQVIVHRDYHSRNLMLMQSPEPGILDFQDAVIGPISYDLVSLLRDAYISWPEEQQLDWAIRYWQDARKASLPVANDFADFWRDFEWMGLQRHLKVLGIFARLYHRDGKAGYLNDLPLVLNYAQSVAMRYVPLAPLARLFKRLQTS